MLWHLSNSRDPRAKVLADRHYSRGKIGSARFVAPGRCLTLLTANGKALWVTHWPKAEYVMHEWPGAWNCALFRNESNYLSSDLIRQAVSATISYWGTIPDQGMITFVDDTKISNKINPGYCFKRAGFRYIKRTKINNLMVFLLPKNEMPSAHGALEYLIDNDQPTLFQMMDLKAGK